MAFSDSYGVGFVYPPCEKEQNNKDDRRTSLEKCLASMERSAARRKRIEECSKPLEEFDTAVQAYKACLSQSALFQSSERPTPSPSIGHE